MICHKCDSEVAHKPGCILDRMSAELVYRQPCEHGIPHEHYWTEHRPSSSTHMRCPGYSETVLDPDKVLFGDDSDLPGEQE